MKTATKAQSARKQDKSVKRAERLEQLAATFAEKGNGIVSTIKHLYTKGFTKSELIESGYNKNTVYRQTREVELGL